MADSAGPSILLIALDCVRADHLGCYGYRGTETPTMDRIAAEGAIFEQAICQCPNTWGSFASVFTGCNPHRHGVRTKFAEIRPDLPALAETLRQLGYRTAGLPGFGFLSRERRFGRGFEEYFLGQESPPGDLARQLGCPKPARQLELLFDWLDRSDGRPFFAWVHYVDTHMWPPRLFDLPREYRRKFSDAWQYYDGKIACADETFIKPIREGLAQRGILDDTILVITADHGETLCHSLDEIPYLGHSHMPLDQAIHVPLILRAPSRIPAGVRVPHQVRSIDLMPTLLDLIGGPSPEDVDGASLVPLLRGEPDPAGPRDAYVENLHGGAGRAYIGIRTGEWKLLLIPPPPGVEAMPKVGRMTLRRVYRRLAETPVIGKPIQRVRRALEVLFRREGPVRSPEHADPLLLAKRILNAGHPIALYNLRDDPEEYYDVAMEHPDVVRDLVARLRNMVTREGIAEVREVEDEERAAMERQLRDLGYL